MDKPLCCEVRTHTSRKCNMGTIGCVRHHGRGELADRIAQLESALTEKEKENAELRKCCSQRGARMQILWRYTGPDLLIEYPESCEWFDKNGVPK